MWCVCNEVYTYVAAALPHLQAVHQTQNCLIFEAHGFTPSECALYMAVYNMILTYMHHLMKVYLVAHASIVVLRSGANERNIISYFNYYLARHTTWLDIWNGNRFGITPSSMHVPHQISQSTIVIDRGCMYNTYIVMLLSFHH